MLFKISKSFVGKMFLIIAVFIGMMAVMVFYCNLYAMWAIRERAVSYTHLDVYKRQGEDRRVSNQEL